MRLYYFVVTLLLSVCFLSHASAGPGDFVADYSSGCSPLVVHFHVSDTCNACTYSWNFGNSTSLVTGDSVSTTYIGVGSYTVTLTVHNGSSVFIKTMPITVYPSPTVSFSVDDTAVCPGAPINFTGTSTSSIAGPLVSTWNYGDGSPTDTGTTPIHAYTAPGYFNVTLVATSSQGCISTLTKVKYIHIYTPPVANFSPTQVSACKAPASFSFTNSATGTGPLTYNWTFGNGASSTIVNPTYNYTASGTYTLIDRVTDIHGCRDSAVKPGAVVIGNIHSSFTFNDPVCKAAQAAFHNTSISDALRVWDYHDGSPLDTGYNASHVFSNPGTYTVTLTIFNGSCSDTSKQAIHVIPKPPVDFTMLPLHPCPVVTTVSFAATGPAGAKYTWAIDSMEFGTGTVWQKALAAGISRIDMFMNDTITGCTMAITKYDTVYDLIPHPSPSPAEGCVPMTSTFSTDPTTLVPGGIPSAYPYPIASYSWDFGDSSPFGSGPTPTHIYTDTGTYKASALLTTIYGCTASQIMELKVGLKHGATFTVHPLHACIRDSIYFVATPNDTAQHVDEYRWDFGDRGAFDSSGKHTYRYTLPGKWVVSVTPVYKGCKDTTWATTDTVTIDSPLAVMAGDYSCYPRTRIILGDSSMGADQFLWIFGDGDTSSVRNPVHNYAAISSYSVSLTTYNVRSGCRDTTSKNFSLLNPDPRLYADDTGLCKHGIVNFTSKINGEVGGAYQWYVNNSLIPGVDTFNQHQFDVPGLYNMMLIIEDAHLCHDTTTTISYNISADSAVTVNHITVASPRPGFTLYPPIGCVPFTVTFTDTTRDVTGAIPDTFAWKFGDGSLGVTNLRTITHVYTTAGTFTVSDAVGDNFGCSDSLSRVAVTGYKARATFFTLNAHPCPGMPVSFTNTTPSVINSYWTFGDDSTSTAKNPVHIYKDTGTYNVGLTVFDSHGCSHTDTLVGYIVVAKPFASFYMSDTTSICAPLPVHFYNTSTGADTSNWVFGDGNISVVPSPNNLYTTPGLFNVRLITSNSYGCRDTAYNNVNIFGYAGAFSYLPHSGCSPLNVHFSSSFTNVAGVTWDFADGNTQVAATLDTISHRYITPGAYVPKLILSDNSGCQSTSIGADTIKVDRVAANFTTTPLVICAGSPFHFVDQSTVRWSPVTSYTWIYNNDTSHLPSPLYVTGIADTYSVHLGVVNGWGCVDTVTKKIIIYPLPDVTASHDTLICASDTATISGYGALTYTWAPPVMLTCTNCSTTKAFPADTTVYIVTGTDSRGCKDTAAVKVNTFSPVIMGTLPICAGESDTLTNTGGNGVWMSSNPAVGTIGSASGIVTAIYAGTTMITYSLSGSCLATKLVTINPEPHAGVIVGPANVCIHDTVILVNDTTGGIWSRYNANASILLTGTGSLKVTGVTTGVDTIMYAVTNVCRTVDTTFVISIAPLPVISGVAYICAGATTSLNATIAGGSWSSLDIAVAVVDVATGIVKGGGVSNLDTADITYTTAPGCKDTTQVAVYPIPDAGAISGLDKVCKGGVLTLTDVPGGGRWGSGDTAVAIIDSFTGVVNAIHVGTAAITYIAGPNAGGCSDTTYYSVKIIDPEFHIVPTVTDLNCYRGHDGSLAVVITNGTPPFHYHWSTGDTVEQIVKLDTGIYTIHIREDITQCESIDTLHIGQPDSLYAIATALTKDICKTSTGSMTSTVRGGIAPYRYQWSNNSTDTGQSAIAAGTYSLSITDIKGCIDTTSVIVEDTSCLGIVVRTGISANNDGINDTWIIEGLQYYPSNTVQVFDKWGDQVFEGKNYKNDWPGTGKNGVLLPDGSYYYLIKLNEQSKTGGNDSFTGTLLIKR